jgi:hypothetical protein
MKYASFLPLFGLLILATPVMAQEAAPYEEPPQASGEMNQDKQAIHDATKKIHEGRKERREAVKELHKDRKEHRKSKHEKRKEKREEHKQNQ